MHIAKPLRTLLICLLIITISVYMIISLIGFNLFTTPPARYAPNTPAGEYREVTFLAREHNYPVYAFFLPGQVNAPVLIDTHGLSGSRHTEFQLNRAAALHRLGYSVLVLDLSDAAGETIGNGRIALGYDEQWDVLGAFDYLITQGYAPGRIGLVGESMGATTSLLAAGVEPRIRTVWADSSYARADSAIGERLMQNGLTPVLSVGFLFWDAALSGAHIWEVAPIQNGKAFVAHQQAIYLIHDEGDTVVLFHHGADLFAAYKAAGVDVTFWSLPGLEHVAGLEARPGEYLQRLDSFFKAHLTWVF